MKGQWGKLAGYFLGTLLVSAAVTFGLPLIGGGSWLPDLISTEGAGVDDLFWGLIYLSLVIFAIVGAIVIYSITHFRAEAGDMSDGAHIHGNAKMEAVWIIIPTIIVFIVGVLSYMVLDDNEVGLYKKVSANTKGDATMTVDVRGFSFGWAFRYDETSEQSPELVVPVKEIIRFDVMACTGKEHLGRLERETFRVLDAHHKKSEFAEIEPGLCEKQWDMTTKDEQKAAIAQAEELHTVLERKEQGKRLTPEQQKLWDAQPRFKGDAQYIEVNHAFWVPETRLKIDAVSGLRTYVQWQPTRITGPDDRYQVVCAELCGTGHNGMRTDMCVTSAETFEWWKDLDAEERIEANCVNLRLLSCLPDDGGTDEGRSKAITAIAKISSDNPDASCDDVTEKI